MKKQEQVCSLEQSIKLKEIGLKQDSLFYHFPNPNIDRIKAKYNLPDYNVVYGENQVHDNLDRYRDHVLSGNFHNTYSAFTASELGELLPDLIEASHKIDNGEEENRQWELFCGKDEDGWFCGYFNASINDHGKFLYQIYGDNEAMSRAEMLIHLVSLKIISIELEAV